MLNSSNSRIQLLYSGDSSYRFSLEPRGIATFHVKSGQYSVAITAEGQDGRYYGRQELRGGSYSLTFNPE